MSVRKSKLTYLAAYQILRHEVLSDFVSYNKQF